jgi:hypothetical protein
MRTAINIETMYASAISAMHLVKLHLVKLH